MRPACSCWVSLLLIWHITVAALHRGSGPPGRAQYAYEKETYTEHIYSMSAVQLQVRCNPCTQHEMNHRPAQQHEQYELSHAVSRTCASLADDKHGCGPVPPQTLPLTECTPRPLMKRTNPTRT